jgi:glutamate dehydrogenase
VRLFARRDPFDRFISVLMFVPRERYDSGVRERAGKILAEAFEGRVSAYYPSFSDAPLARVHYVLGVTPGKHGEPDMAALEAKIAETARTWDDRFEAPSATAARRAGSPRPWPAGRRAFPPGYRDQYDAAEALADLAVVDALGADEQVRVRAFRRRRRQADLPLQALSPRRRRAPGRRAADPGAHGPEGADRGRLQADPHRQ